MEGAMPATTAEETHRLFGEAFNQGDLDALVNLYEEDAVFLAQPGQQPARATAEVREALRGFIGMGGTFSIERTDSIASDEVAIVCSTWKLAGASDPEGNTFDLNGQTTDVVRCQPDGSWLFAIDNPWGVHAFAAQPAST
jgi:ketosteroid isomerase-like protein